MLPLSARVALVVALAIAVPGDASTRALGGGERAFVAAEADGQLVAVDLDDPPGSPAVVARLRVARGPHNVAVSTSRRFLLVTSPPAGRVTLVESHAPRIVGVVGGLAYPHDVEFEPAGRFAYVTEERGDRIAVVDVTRLRVVRRVAVERQPHDLAVGSFGNRVFVTHGPATRHVTVLDTRRPSRTTVIGRIAVPGAPHDIAVACGERRVWLTFWGSGTVAALNPRSGRVVVQRRAGRLVHHIQAAGKDVWVTDHHGARARLLDGCSGRVLRTLKVGGSPHHVGVGPFAGHAVVASQSGTITVLRTQCECVHRVRVGRGLHGVAVAGVP
ncbi:MAG: YncE family protein [Gaiellaceae bacterium]